MRAPWLRPLGFLVSVLFAANAALPVLPHGCGGESLVAEPAEPHTMAQAEAGPHGGQHQDHSSPGRQDGRCDCIGHSCCLARVSLPAGIAFSFEGNPPVLAVARPVALPAPHPRTEHLLPPAQGPPLNN